MQPDGRRDVSALKDLDDAIEICVVCPLYVGLFKHCSDRWDASVPNHRYHERDLICQMCTEHLMLSDGRRDSPTFRKN